MNSAIGNRARLAPQRDETATMTPIHAPRRIARDPVTAIGDLAVPAEDDQPEDRHEREPDREADERRADEPGAGFERPDRGS